MLNGFGWPHLLIIAVLIILLFGAKRLPDAARGLGRSLQIFKSETRGLRENEQEHQGGQQNSAQNGASGFPNPGAYTSTPPQQIPAPQPTQPPAEQVQQPQREQQH